MIIFHISDLHIGLKLYKRDLSEDQQHILNQVIDKIREEKPDVLLVAGDIYDRAVPSAESVRMFDNFVTAVHSSSPETFIMIISGNHDSSERINTFRTILETSKIYMIGVPPTKADEYIKRVTLHDEYGEVNFYILPFVQPIMLQNIVGKNEADDTSLSYNDAFHRLIERENIDTSRRNVIISHQFFYPVGKTPEDIEKMDSETRKVGNLDAISADILERFDYAALGHIHKPMKVGSDTIRYCGTPMQYSVSEAGQKKSILRLELKEKGNYNIREIPLVPLREIKKIEDTLENILSQGCTDYVSITITDKVDFDTFDVREKLDNAFENILEVKRKKINSTSIVTAEYDADSNLEPYDICVDFINTIDPEHEITEEEEKMLTEAINEANGGTDET